ncbi:MAG: hypothetical protein V3U71_06100 [Cocleimonas sp.]
MNHSKKIIASAVLLATSSFAIAATDTTEIEINVTKNAYVNFIGTLQGNTVQPLSTAQVDGVTTTLGTLGFESNTTGTCTVSFSTVNDYKLVHAGNAALDLGSYTFEYAGVTNTTGTANDYLAPNCNEAVSNVTIANPALPGVVTAGTYSDTVTITVATQ